MPGQLADFYLHQGKFFRWHVNYRNAIDHHGKTFQWICLTEKGFAVSLRDKPFSTLGIWNEQNTIPHNFGSLRSAISHVVANTLKTLEEFAHVMKTQLKFPYDIAPEYDVYIRGPHVASLVNVEKYINEMPWYDTNKSA